MSDEKEKGFGGFGKKILGIFDKGVSASKKGLQSAGTAVSDFGEKSVLRIEKSQLQGKVDKAYAELGKLAFKKLSSSRSAVISASDTDVAGVVGSIKNLLADIDDHTDAINEVKSTDTTSDSSAKKPAPAKKTSTKSSASTKTSTAKTSATKTAAKTGTAKASSAKTGATKTASSSAAKKTGTTAAKKSGSSSTAKKPAASSAKKTTASKTASAKKTSKK